MRAAGDGAVAEPGRPVGPLRAARAGVGALWCLVLAGAALAVEHPLALLALAAAVAGAVLGSGAGRHVARVALLAAPLALLVALVNPFVVRDGTTVLFRVGEVPPLGQVDLTLEATVYGLVLGARTLLVVLACALLAAAVDPDELLRALRRVSLRSGLTAALATRLVPVLARDGRRLAEGARCRAVPAGRAALVRAVAAGALDRAVDVAATLELRGYGLPGRPPASGAPWSRHDLALLASALAVVALVAAGELTGATALRAYPELDVAGGPEAFAVAAGLAAAALSPFLARRGVAR